MHIRDCVRHVIFVDDEGVEAERVELVRPCITQTAIALLESDEDWVAAQKTTVIITDERGDLILCAPLVSFLTLH